MRRRSLLLLAFATTAAADTPKDPYAPLRGAIVKLVGGSYDGAVLAQLTDLGDSVGPRLTGSPRYDKGVAWAIAQLKAAGAQNVHVEKFGMEHGWQRGTARGAMIAPVARPLHLESAGWSPSTPAGGLRAQAIEVKLDALPAPKELKGKIVVFDLSALPDDRGELVVRKGFQALKDGGAVAALAYGPAANNVVGTGGPSVDGKLGTIPNVVLGLEDAKAITRQLARGPVTIELAITNTVTGPIQVANVIGELKGRDRPDEWLLIGAHLDSWDFATGSQDNGSGVVQVIQSARLLAAAGPLRRSVRFALWGGEEQGLVGSHAYVVAHTSELGACIAALNTDNGAGHVLGWKVQKRKDVQTALTPIANQLLANLGAGKVDMTLTNDTDHFSFAQAGVPALDLLVDMSSYYSMHHKQGDTIDKVDPHALASGLAVVAVTAYAIAMSSERLGPRLERPAVEDLFKPVGYDELLKLDGWWK